MSFPIYLLKASLALSFCWILYRSVFRELTFFQWNRFYLLASVMLSLSLPLLRIHWGNSLVETAGFGWMDWTYMEHLGPAPAASSEADRAWSAGSLIRTMYLLVASGLLFRSAFRLGKLSQVTRQARRVRKGRVPVYVQDQHRGSFTVFRRVYLDRHTYERKLRPVLRHEMVHALQLHSLDLLLMEFVVALLWFNPFVYFLLQSIRENHEYQADRIALGNRDELTEYLECLKAETIRYFTPVPASYFNSSTLKKRIIMLTNHKSHPFKKWRYLGMLPLAAFMLIFFHVPGEQGQAGAVPGPEGIFNLSGSTFRSAGVPSLFPLPMAYREKITWGYEQRALHPITRKETTHLGIDLAAPTGTPVYAAADGIVQKAEQEKGWGKLVVLEHEGGYATFYAHLNEIAVESGKKVSRGQVIGRVGNTGQSTGSHLHYEVRLQGKHLNPSDFY